MECPRRYELRYVVGAGGWRSDASPLARTAYRLSQLTTLSQALGAALHRRAAEYAAACRDGLPLPTLKQSRDRTAGELNWLYAASKRHRADNERDPRTWPMLFESFYWNGPSREQIDRVRAKCERSLINLHACSLWSEVGALEPHQILIVDRLDDFMLDGVQVFAAPDLVFQPDDGSAPIIVEFKSGSVATAQDLDDVKAQLSVYGLFLARSTPAALEDGGCKARLILLDDGSEYEFDITAVDLDRAAARIRSSAQAIADGGGFPDFGERDRLARLPLTTDRSICKWCEFRAVCWPQLDQIPAAEPASAPAVASCAADAADDQGGSTAP